MSKIFDLTNLSKYKNRTLHDCTTFVNNYRVMTMTEYKNF